MDLAIVDVNQSEYIDSIFIAHSEVSLCSRIVWERSEGSKQLYPLVGGKQDAVLIVARENMILAQILVYLHDLTIKDIFAVRLFTIDQKKDFLTAFYFDKETSLIVYDKKLIDKIPAQNEKPYLVHLETHVCDHCNLNCKACNNFSPYVKEPTYADPIQFEKDIRHLAELFGGIGRFFLLGGEPLLAPELCCEMIRIYRKYFHDNELRVLTNATRILSMEDSFWDCIRDNDVIIHISLYPPVRESIDAIESRLIEKGISYIIFKRVERFAKRLTEYPFEDPVANNLRCGSGGCHYLRNGMITKCPDAWLSGYLPGNLGEKYQSKDILNLYESNAWEIIRKTNAPIDLCRYCACSHMELIEWEPVGREPDPADWIARHRYEYEKKKLSDQLDLEKEHSSRERERLLQQLNSEKNELREKNRINEKLIAELDTVKDKLYSANNSIRVLEEELSVYKSEQMRVSSSYSFRL